MEVFVDNYNDYVNNRRWEAMNDPSSPQGQAIAESRRRKQQQLRDYEQYSATVAAERKAYEEAKEDYYRSIREENGDIGRNFSEEALRLIAAAQPAIETAEDKQYMKERIAAADMYADLFNVSFENAFLNLDNFHRQWMGEKFTKKTGVEAVIDSVKLSFVSREYNELNKKLAKSPDDPDLLKAVQEYEKKIDKLRDHTPKFWQDDYVNMGGWDDVGQFIRSVGTSLGENAVPIAEGMAWATLAATGVGAFGSAAGLSATASKILVAGASRLAIAGSTYNSTWGIKYREMRNEGIPHDIAKNYAQLDALVEGIIEGSLGGVEAAGAQAISRTIVPQAINKATTRFFISGRMGAGAKAILNVLKEGFEEGSEEFLQGISSGRQFNAAAKEANKPREEKLREIASKPFGEMRRELEEAFERELKEHPEKYPDVKYKEWKDILDEAFEGSIAGFLTGIILGIPIEITNYKSDVHSAMLLAEMAREAPNAAALVDSVNTARQQGIEFPVLEGLKTDDEEIAVLTDVQKVQWERMTPEQREAKQKQAQDAAALAEVTNYSDTEVDEETGELVEPETSDVYKEDGQFHIAERTTINEDGSTNGRYIAADPRIEDNENTEKQWYGHIDYTEKDDTITINEFQMKSRYENLRSEFYDQFAGRFAGKNIVWNPKTEQNIALRDQLISLNPRGIKEGLNYYENKNQIKVSNEARQVAKWIKPYMNKNTSELTIAMTVEGLKFMRLQGETLNDMMHRLLGKLTNEAPKGAIAAQEAERLKGHNVTVQGGTFTMRNAAGVMERFTYINKNASDVSTIAHEAMHVAKTFFNAETKKAAEKALNGYVISKGQFAGQKVIFNENTGTWSELQEEALADAWENFLTTGTVQNEELKSLFEKIKEFLKQIYEKFKGWTELSPAANEFFQKLVSGELNNQEQAQTAQQTNENSHSEAQTEKTINDTTEGNNATEAQQDTAKEKTHTTTPDHTTQRDAIINDPDIPLEEKAQAVLDEAGEALYQAGEYDQTEIYKKGISLDEAQTSLFSSLENGKPITLQNSKTGDAAWLSKSSIGKLLSNEAVRKSKENGFSREQHYAVASDIARLFYNAEKLFERPDKNNDPNVKIHRYAAPLNFDENVALITVKESVQHGKRIYTTELMEIEKLEGILKEAENTAHFPSSSSAINNLINKVRNVNTHEAKTEGSTLFQLSDEQKETFEAAKEVYGTTKDFREAGYLLIDGTMLDLSGKKDGGEPGHRKLEHREMNHFEHKGKVYKPGMDGFMLMGNIRLSPEFGGIELTKSPNNEQTGTLRNYIKHNKGDVIVDFSKENLDVENSIEYSGANADRVLNDIKNYYEKGELPPEVPILFQTAWNTSVAMFDRFDNYYAGRSGFTKTHGWGHSFYSRREAADWFGKKLEEYKGASTWLYEAKIPDDSELMEWEKPLDSQPEKVKNAAVELITWGKDGKSNFNEAYNIRQFKDGKYGFFRSINGKMKWATIEEAQTAAKAEIMKALNGEDFYTGIAQLVGEKNTSLLLDNLGIKGIKYLDKTLQKMGLPVSHSYTVFGDHSIAMTPLLFQTAFHGSPFQFDRFDSSHMGKGEGAQAYGWGHYFAEKKEVADWYHQGLVPHLKLEELPRRDQHKFYNLTKEIGLNDYIVKELNKKNLFLDELQQYINNNGKYPFEVLAKWLGSAEKAQELAIEYGLKSILPGQLYEVDVPGDEEMLDWDKKLLDSPIYNDNWVYKLERLRELGRKEGLYLDGITLGLTGEEIYTHIKQNFVEEKGLDYNEAQRQASLLLNESGFRGIRYLDGDSRGAGEGSHNYVIFDDNEIKITRTFYDMLFQFGDREMMEEAADYENGKNYRSAFEIYKDFFEKYEGWEKELQGLSEEQIDAWFDKFVEKSKQAVNSTEETPSEGKLTPAELDREFNDMIKEEGKLEEFVEIAAALYNEDGRFGGISEEDADTIDLIRRTMKHTTWETIFKAQGKIGEKQRKGLLTMIQHSPREYRNVYAAVMEREDLAVSEEDFTAEILKYKIADSRRDEIDRLSPEKLRQLAEDIAVEEYAKKVRTGRAEFNDPIEKVFIKRLQEQIKQDEEKIKEITEEQQEDNNYFERLAGKEFLEKFERITEARAFITRKHEELDRAIKTGEKDAAKIARQLQRANSNYDSVMQTLQKLADMHNLEVDIQKALSEQALKDYAKSAKTEATMLARLARKAALAEYKSHLADLKEQQQKAKEITKAKRGVVKRIFRKASPQTVNADQGMAVASIQRFAEPSFKKGINEFIGEIEKYDLRPVYEAWKVDEKLRNDLLKDKPKNTQNKMRRLFNKEKFEDLTSGEKLYLSRKIAPMDWIEELGLEEISNRRNENYPVSEAERQIAQQYLPSDVYYRIMDKPFSAWTLTEAEELAKIIDDLVVQGKQIYKANIDAEQKRIRAYQNAVRQTVRTVIKKGKVLDDNEEVEKILNKYDEGMEGTEESAALRRKLRGKFPKYADMNVYRFARMLDNGDTNGKNSAALYRAARDALNQELAAKDARREKVLNRLKELKIKEGELWQKTVELDLGGRMGKKEFTAWELIGFLMAIRDDYSRAAVVGGNLLVESERNEYQKHGITKEEVTPLQLIAGDRFVKVNEAAQKLIAENPKYQQVMDVLDEDFAVSGRRTGEALLRYNNTFMDIRKYYFPMQRTEAISSETAGAQEIKKLMGSSAGAFNMFVEKGFTEGRAEIPIQYQRGIKLDAFAVWTEAVEREEHFIAYAQTVKDLNKIYKQSRPVRNAIQQRYGIDAVKFIDKYINELANPNEEKTRDILSGFIKNMRGNAAAAYLSFNVTSILKQGITSPAPFMGYMNPIEYTGTLIEYATHRKAMWQEICELSPYMKHRSANMMVELVKEQARQKFENKADAAISKMSKVGMGGLEWIDEMCVAPGWLVLFRKEQQRLTKENANAKMSEKDIKVKAAQYADDITSITQPSGYAMDIPQLFKSNNELTKAYLQFTQSLSNIWQNVRYDLPQMIRDHRVKNAVGTIIGYTLAGIMLGRITAGFNDDDDDETKMKKLVGWATTQFTDSFPIIGSEVTYLAEQLITGKPHYSSGANLVPAFEKIKYATQTGMKGIQEGDFNKIFKAAAQAFEGAAIYKGLPVSGSKTLGRTLGIGDGDGEPNINPKALLGRR